MLENIFNRKDIKDFLADTITQIKYNNKEIPNTICEEKITKEQYCLYIAIDSIIKYFIIIGDYNFDVYFEQIKKALRKLQTHNDIVIAVNRLLINAVMSKLNVREETQQSKKIIIKYFYGKYIKEGYLYHSYPSYFYEDNKMIDIDNFYYDYDEIKEINEIFNKNKIENNLKKDELEPSISFTDSSFTAPFYAYNNPIFLYELCTKVIKNNTKNEINNNSFFYREYNTCYNQLNKFLGKRDIAFNEKNKILLFFKEEWKNLNTSNNEPLIAFIKRKTLNKDSLENYDNLINSENSLENIVKYILETRLYDEKSYENIKPEFYLKLPNINELLNKEEMDDKEQLKENEQTQIDNNYGNATILALFGTLLIALGVTITIIMIGR